MTDCEAGTAPACPRCGETRVWRSFDDGASWVRVRYRCGRQVIAGTRFPGDDDGFAREDRKCRRGIWRDRAARYFRKLWPTAEEWGAFGVRLAGSATLYAGSGLLTGKAQWLVATGAHFLLFLGLMTLVSRAEKVCNAAVREAIRRAFAFLTGRPVQLPAAPAAPESI